MLVDVTTLEHKRVRPFDRQGASFRQTDNRLPPLYRRGQDTDRQTCCSTIPRREENARDQDLSKIFTRLDLCVSGAQPKAFVVCSFVWSDDAGTRTGHKGFDLPTDCVRPFDKQAAAFRQTACVLSTNRLPPLDRRRPDIDHPTCCFTSKGECPCCLNWKMPVMEFPACTCACLSAPPRREHLVFELPRLELSPKIYSRVWSDHTDKCEMSRGVGSATYKGVRLSDRVRASFRQTG